MVKKFREIMFGDMEKGEILVDRGLVNNPDSRRSFLIRPSEQLIRKGKVEEEEMEFKTLWKIGALPRDDSDADVGFHFVERQYPEEYVLQLENPNRVFILCDVNGQETLLLKYFLVKVVKDIQRLKQQITNLDTYNKTLLAEMDEMLNNFPSWMKNLMDVKEIGSSKPAEGDEESEVNV